MADIGVGDLVKLKTDIFGNSQKCLGLKKDNRTGLVTEIQKDPAFVQVENEQASSPSIYRKDHLSPAPVAAPVAAPAQSPTMILKTKLNQALSALDSAFVKCEKTYDILARARLIQRNINTRASNPTAIRKIQLIDSVSGILAAHLGDLREDRTTGAALKLKYNEKVTFGDLATISYNTLIDSINTHIGQLNRTIHNAKNNMAESRYLPGILSEIVAGGKRSKTLGRKRKNRRRTIKAPSRR